MTDAWKPRYVLGRSKSKTMPLAHKWLREHSVEYAGRWVALRDDVLVADARDFDELCEKLPSLEGVLVTIIESSYANQRLQASSGRLLMRASRPDPGSEPRMRTMPLAEAWIREHGKEYVGRWVALRDDVLVADARTFKEVTAQLDRPEDYLVTLID